MRYIIREDVLNKINNAYNLWIIDEQNMRLIIVKDYEIKEMEHIKQKRNGMIQKLKNNSYSMETGYVRDSLIMEHCMNDIYLPENKLWKDHIKDGIENYPFKEVVESDKPIDIVAKELQKICHS
ncbi:TPA: hypothetical protein OW056_002730 [Staphylococcus aureus]|nr:hypothetical protein [Staphylococcus aureus]HCW0039252.1 hypothetical protein [Staphylococcus aureus]